MQSHHNYVLVSKEPFSQIPIYVLKYLNNTMCERLISSFGNCTTNVAGFQTLHLLTYNLLKLEAQSKEFH